MQIALNIVSERPLHGGCVLILLIMVHGISELSLLSKRSTEA